MVGESGQLILVAADLARSYRAGKPACTPADELSTASLGCPILSPRTMIDLPPRPSRVRPLLALAFLLCVSRSLLAQCVDHQQQPVALMPWEALVEERLTARAAALGEAPQKITVTVGGVTFDSDYDNGHLGSVVSAGTNTFNCTILSETGISPGATSTAKYWYRFRMTGVAGKTITLNIDHTQNMRPFIRLLPGGVWRRSTATEAPTTSRLVYTFTAQQNQAELAFFHPLGMQETYDEVAAIVATSPYATMQSIGTSLEGRPMYLVTVNDTRWPDARKHRVWVHSRAHAGEVTSTHTMLGFLEQMVAPTPDGARLRQNVILNVVPLLNVDGAYLGKTRWDSLNRDIERQWCTPVTHPEALVIKPWVDQFMASDNPIEVALNLHSTVGSFTDSFFFKHLTPSVSAEFETIQQDYIDAFNNATPLFDNRSAQSSQLAACIFIESYFWNNWGKNVMAMTHEGHFYRRITDNEFITGEDYRELGRAQMRGLFEYFNLPAVEPENAAFVLR